MSVEYFREIHSGRGGGDSIENAQAEQQYTRVFRCKTTAASDDSATVLADANCPKYGAAHPGNAFAFVRNRSARQETMSKLVWIVQINYSTSSREWEDDPTDDPAQITWRSEQFQRVAYKDKNGEAIVNSAGDYYDPPPEKDDSRWIVTVVKNLSAVPSWVLTYQDAINSSSYTLDGLTIAARKSKMQSIEISPWQNRNGTAFRTVTFAISVAADGFELDILDQGFNKLTGSGSGQARVKITLQDDEGNTVEPSAPVLLDGAGGVLANPSPSTAIFRTHYVYNEQDFSSLPLT